MEEINEIHNLNLEWGCITNLMNKISDIENNMEGGWPELIEMVADAVDEEGENEDPVSAFFSLYQFLFRLYYRLKTNPVKKSFNQYSKDGDKYWITNYDYKTFSWVIKNNIGKQVDNLVIKIPKDNLTTSQQRAFERRCK